MQGPFILRQHKGVPIGGTCSAQLASAYCLWCEYNLPPDATQDQICQPVRFRDNIIGIMLAATSGKELKLFYEAVYKLPLQVETIAKQLNTLEVHLSLRKGRLYVFWNPKGLFPSPSDPKSLRPLVDPWSHNSRQVVLSSCPSFALKSLHYASSALLSQVNFAKLYHLLSRFPVSWYHSFLRKAQSGRLTAKPGSGWTLVGQASP